MRPAARRAIRVALAIVVPILLGAVVVLVLALTPWGNERVRRFAVKRGNARLNGELSIETLRGNLFRGATLTNVRIVDSTRRPLFSAKRVSVRYGLLPALRGQVVIQSVVLDTPDVILDRPPGMRWNFQSLLKPSGPRDTLQKRARPEIGDITIHHGRFVYRREWTPGAELTPPQQEIAVEKALAPDARKRTERAGNGFQRVLEYRDIDAHIPHVELGQGKQPVVVQIAALSMIAEPYRPPAIDIRSLVGTLYASSDSLWWRGARMRMPGSDVTGDGTIGFHRSGFMLNLSGAPIALADLRWLDPKLPADGGGRLRYEMRLHGDSSEYAVSNADIRFERASVIGDASVVRVKHGDKPAELVLRGADLTIAQVSTALVRRFVPTVKIRRDGTLGGRIVARGSKAGVDLDADLRFDDVASGTSRVVARGDLSFIDGVRTRGMRVRMLPLRLSTVEGFGVKMPVDGTLTGETQISGASRSGWNVSGDVTHSDRGESSRVSGSGSYRVAGKHIVADASLKPLSLVTVGRLVPKAELRGSVSGHVHAEGTARNLAVSGEIQSTSGGGSVQGRGTLTLAGSRTRYDVAIRADALNAYSFSSRAPRTLLNGTISARGVGTKPATMNAVLSADLTRSRYDTFTVERLLARVALANGLARVDTLAAIALGVRANARGSFGIVEGKSGSLAFSAVVDSLGALRPWLGVKDSTAIPAASGRQSVRVAAARADSTRRAEAVRIERLALGLPEGVELAPDTLPSIRRDSLAGSLAASGTLTGNIKELGVDAIVRGSGLVARGASVSRLVASLRGNDVRNKDGGLEYSATIDSLQATGRLFERVESSGRWAHNTLTAAVRAKQDSLVSYAAVGSYAHPDSGQHLITLDSLSARFDTLVWRLAHRGGVKLSHGRIDIDSIDLRSSMGGRLFANGYAPKTGAMQLDVAAENVRVSTVLAALQQERDADGIIGLAARITGTRPDPVMTARATLRDAFWKQVRAPDVDLDARYSGQRLAVDATARDTMGRRVFVSTASLPFNLALEPVKESRRVAGALTADLTIDTLSLEALPIRTRAVEDIRGFLSADAHARGTWSKVDVTGRAGLRGGALRMPLSSTGMRVDNAVADLRFVRDTLFVDSLTALARGPLRASGTVAFDDVKRPVFNLVATGDNVRVFDSPRGLVDANARVFASGPLDSLRVTGTGEMLGGYLALKQFRKDLLRVKAPGELSFFAVYDTSATDADRARAAQAATTKRRFAVLADLSLTIDRGNYYRNRPDANSEFYTGDDEQVMAHLDTRSSDQWAVGFVRIGHGIATFRTRAFIPQRGTLTFTPHTGAAGLVQQVGERVVWEPGRGLFPIQLLTGGTSTGPAVGLESGSLFPIRGRELNGYLTLGRLNLSLLQQSGSTLSGSEGWSGQLSGETGALARRQQGATALGVVLHDIGTGATKEWSLDAFSVSPADLPTELVFGKTGGVRGAVIEGGKYLTTEMYVAGQLHFTRGIPGLRMQRFLGTTYRVDVGIEPRFLFRNVTDLGITHPTVRSGAFGAYVTRMWGF